MLKGGISLLAAALVASLILAGWGFDDLSGFIEEPARLVGLLAAGAGAGLSVHGLRFRVEMKSEAAGQQWLAVFNLAAFAVALWLLPFLDRRAAIVSFLHVPGDAFRWIGVFFLAGGQVLSVWAIQTLGRWFSPRIGVQRGHELITTGPYRILRHPFYTGLLMAMAGFPAVFGSWLGIVLVVAALPVILYRVEVEEAHLEQEFGDGYRAMRDRTWRLIPYVH